MPITTSSNIGFPIPGATFTDYRLADIQAVKSALISIDTQLATTTGEHTSELDPHPQYLLKTQATESSLNSKVNSESSPIYFGQPVYSVNDTQIGLAISDNEAKRNVVGLVSDALISGSMGSGFIQTFGIIVGTVAQWEAVTNSIGGLIAGKFYFLDSVLGTLTTSPNHMDGNSICYIGQAITNTTFTIRIQRPIIL